MFQVRALRSAKTEGESKMRQAAQYSDFSRQSTLNFSMSLRLRLFKRDAMQGLSLSCAVMRTQGIQFERLFNHISQVSSAKI